MPLRLRELDPLPQSLGPLRSQQSRNCSIFCIGVDLQLRPPSRPPTMRLSAEGRFYRLWNTSIARCGGVSERGTAGVPPTRPPSICLVLIRWIEAPRLVISRSTPWPDDPVVLTMPLRGSPPRPAAWLYGPSAPRGDQGERRGSVFVRPAAPKCSDSNRRPNQWRRPCHPQEPAPVRVGAAFFRARLARWRPSSSRLLERQRLCATHLPRSRPKALPAPRIPCPHR